MQHFTLEAILWSQLQHPNVLPFLGLEPQEQGMPLMVLPWLGRGNVMDYMRELSSTPPASQLNAWVRLIQRALFCALSNSIMVDIWCYLRRILPTWGGSCARRPSRCKYSKNTWHRVSLICNIGQRNVLISDDGTALVGDFGLSVFSSDHSNNYGSQRGGHDRCIAPELLDPGKFGMTSSRPTFRSDVYALGCFYYEVSNVLNPHQKAGITNRNLFQIYAKRSPFDNMNLMYGQRKIVRGERPDRPSAPDQPAMSDELWTLVQTAWCQQPPRRPTANQVLADLQNIVLHTWVDLIPLNSLT